MKTRKFISSLLVSLLLLGIIPLYASAAEPITLTRDNIYIWPTVTNLDGSTPKSQAFAGQKYNDIWALDGGEVRYDANGNGELEENEIIPGTFVFHEERILDDNAFIKINFIPQDEKTYTRIDKAQNSTAMGSTGEVTIVTPEILELPVATEVEANARLRTSSLSGGIAKHPITGEEISYGEWAWASSGKKVTESGYYPVEFFVSASFEIITEYILVRIKGDTSEVKMATSIVELPTPSVDTATVGDNISSITLTGGKVVGMNGEEVNGTFSFVRTGKFTTAGTQSLQITFTPDDERYSTSTAKISITIAKADFAFIDENGNAYTPVIAIDRGVKMENVQAALKALTMNSTENLWFKFADGVKNTDYAVPGTYNVTVTSYEDNSNFNQTTLTIEVVYNTVELTPAITAIGLNKFKVNCGDYKPAGTFTITCNGEEVATVKANQDFNCEVWTDNGGSYEIKAKYNPTENDNFIISDAEWAITVYAKRNLTVSTLASYTVNGNTYTSEVRANDIIVAKTSYEDFAHYVIKDGSGKEIVLEGVDLTSREITFAMPDNDVKITIKTNEQLEQEEAIKNCDHLCHSENPIMQLLWKVLHFIFRLFNVQQYCDCGMKHYESALLG